MNVNKFVVGKSQLENKGVGVLAQPQVQPSDPSAFLLDLGSKLNANSTLDAPTSIDARKEELTTPHNDDLRKAFQDFVGQTLFSQMIASMRSTQGEVAYFNGGRAEKIFQGQLDQILSEELSNASASKISDPMFKLFQLRRQ